MDRKKRIALYGGTFDPVHLGHLEVARKVSLLFEIDQLLFIPAQLAPHKLSQEVTAALHRYAMLALATQEEPRQSISTFELDAPGRRYTVDTLAYFLSELASADLFFVMGADSWMEITTWREWERVLMMASHIVITRPGYDVSSEPGPASSASQIVDLRGFDHGKTAQILERTEGQRVFITDAVMTDISATDIRRAARAGCRDHLVRLVPAAVASYIGKYRLYRDSNET